MADWDAPAKLNLSLEVRPLDRSGYHPIRSLVQTIEWCDVLRVEAGDEDRLSVVGADLPEDGENLVWRAVSALVSSDRRPRLDIELTKEVAVAAGLGGGSSDAAATLRAVADLCRLKDVAVRAAAEKVGSDVPYLLIGGTAWMEGRGERVTALDALDGFAVAVVVPPFELSTPEVYRRWDDLGAPTGPGLDGRALPPSLRAEGPLRNDLTPAALDLAPDLGDWIVDLERRWERPVAMSGSGPSLYALFTDLDEATSAVAEGPGDARAAKAAELRAKGAAPAEH